MTRLAPTLTACLLAALLALTSVSMAVARGGMSLSGAMILCMNATQVVVPLGPDGQPQDHAPACPDCTMGALALAEIAPLGAPIRRAGLLQAAPLAPASYAAPARPAQARGPPVLV